MSKIITAPESLAPCKEGRCLFIAGTITGSMNWQENMSERLSDALPEMTILNPRRQNFDVENKEDSIEQIAWEHFALRAADQILFWFSNETIAPITLYELGAWSNSDKWIFVGIDPNYERKLDVEVQTLLCIPEMEFSYSLDELYEQVVKYNT